MKINKKWIKKEYRGNIFNIYSDDKVLTIVFNKGLESDKIIDYFINLKKFSKATEVIIRQF